MLDALISNWPLKLLAFALAFAIWVTVTGEHRIVKDFPVPLELDLSASRIVTVDLPNTVTVRLRGSESLMRRVDSLPMELKVDLQDVDPGERDVLLGESDLLGVPRGVEVEFIDPDRLSLEIEQRTYRELPVDLTFLGQPPEGFAFYDAAVTPTRLTVEGPESEVEPLQQLSTNPIRLDQRRQPFDLEVGVVPDGANVRVVDPSPLRVHVEVHPTRVERVVEDVVVALEGQLFETTIEPSLINVTLSGPPAAVESVLPDQIVALVDVTGLGPSARAVSLPLTVEFLELEARHARFLSIKSASRRTVKVTVSGNRQVE
ncbi:MAG: hypothetical protein GY716_24745 [bacterium]|nr:hypothetical protein [bacterium]